MISLQDIQVARKRLLPYIQRTSLVHSHTLSERLKTNVYLKLEMFQQTGSFKVRGAFNKLLSLDRKKDFPGVVAVSGGNHAQAVAYAAHTLGLRSLIVMPKSTPKNYLEATANYGGDIHLAPTINEAFEKVKDFEKEGWVFVHPFSDPVVIAGQGTIGLEVLEDLPAVTDVVVSIGGGGLAGGIATAVKSIDPKIKVWGVETKGTDAMAQSLAKNRVITLPKITSIAVTLGTPSVSELTLKLAQKYLESVTVVSDASAMNALELLLERAKVLTEPAASCTLAAAEKLAKNFTSKSHVVLILCGGNISLDSLCSIRKTMPRK